LGKHLKKYETSESDLLVFSQKSGRLYGFDQFGASLFSLIEKDIHLKEILLDDFKENEAAQSLIYTICDLMKGEELPEPETNEAFTIDYPLLEQNKINLENPFYYRLNQFDFVIDTKQKWIIEKVLPALEHLKFFPHNTSNFSLIITFEEDDEGWCILFNEKCLHKGVKIIELLPILMDYIRIGYYHSIDYLISLHAGALNYQGKSLILPAISGSGKSTLSTYLMEQGFSFLTDEVALIDTNEYLQPIPMSITLKEGSWKVLETYGVSFKNLSVHRRFDNQRVSFLPPKNVASGNLTVKGAFLIFPQYRQGAKTEITPLSTLETLARITLSGYEVKDSFDWHTVKRWVQLIEGFHKYAITYSDMEDVRLHIERLITA